MGNCSCVLKEIGMVKSADINSNEYLKIDVTGMVKAVKAGDWGTFPDTWLEEHHIKDCETCATYADTIPSSVFAECAYGEHWGRIMMFFKCEKESKYKVFIITFKN